MTAHTHIYIYIYTYIDVNPDNDDDDDDDATYLQNAHICPWNILLAAALRASEYPATKEGRAADKRSFQREIH